MSDVILAYEPVWAIGENGSPATPKEAEMVHHAIRQALIQCYGESVAEQCVLLYGGSANLENTGILLRQANIDGVFVGRTAWNEQGYNKLLEIAQKI